MSRWSYIKFVSGPGAVDPTDKIHDAYQRVQIERMGSPTVAVFSSALDSHVTTYYFSPDAFDIGAQFSAKICEKPLDDQIRSLVCGEGDAMRDFFPARKSRYSK